MNNSFISELLFKEVKRCEEEHLLENTIRTVSNQPDN